MRLGCAVLQGRDVEGAQIVARDGPRVTPVTRVFEGLVGQRVEIRETDSFAAETVGKPHPGPEVAERLRERLGLGVQDGPNARELLRNGRGVPLDRSRQAKRVGKTVVKALLARERVR